MKDKLYYKYADCDVCRERESCGICGVYKKCSDFVPEHPVQFMESVMADIKTERNKNNIYDICNANKENNAHDQLFRDAVYLTSRGRTAYLFTLDDVDMLLNYIRDIDVSYDDGVFIVNSKRGRSENNHGNKGNCS